MRLDIGVLCAEKRLCSVDGKLLNDIDIFAAAVISRTGVTLGVFVGQVRWLPIACITARLVKFSDAISSIWSR